MSSTLRSSPGMRAAAERFTSWRKTADGNSCRMLSREDRAEALSRVAASIDRTKRGGDTAAIDGEVIPPQARGAPTPERAAKVANGISSEVSGRGDAGDVVPQRRYIVRSAFDGVKQHFEAHEIELLARFVMQAELVTRANVTGSYEGFTSKGTGRARMGGLGNVTDDIRAAHAHHEMVKRKLGPRFLEVAAWLLLEVRAERLNRPLGLHEVGQQVFPLLKDKATTRGISMGLLKALVWRIDQIERYERALTREPAAPRKILSVMSAPNNQS